MAVFFMWVALMIFISVAVLMWPLLRAETPDSSDRQAVNLAIAKQRLRELGLERENGALADDAYAQAKVELELMLAGDLDDADDRQTTVGGRWMAGLVLLAVPLAAVWLYSHLGSPVFLEDRPALAQVSPPASESEAPTAASVASMIEQLEAHMQDEPDDPEGQRLLIRTYMSQARYADAVSALESWGVRERQNPDLLVMLADASASLNGGRLVGESEQLLREALALNPDHLQGLWIMGYTQAQKNNTPEAVAYWQRLLPLLAADSDAVSRVRKVIEEARAQAGLGPDIAEPTVAPGAGLALRVSLDPAVAAQVSPDDVVYVYAKSPTGPPMPLAVLKLRVADLPLLVTLDDSTAMMPNHKLSLQSRVIVGARVSLGGGPVAQPGDFYIEVENVELPVEGELALSITLEK